MSFLSTGLARGQGRGGDSGGAAWRRFVLTLLATVASLVGLAFAFVAAIDPWDALPVHLRLPRVPVDRSQRWAYPALARAARFDAIIIGTSAARLIDPAVLDPALDARFANLAMVHAEAWEQLRLLDVFLAAHPAPNAVLVGLDFAWCTATANPDPPLFGYEPLPEWLYGDAVLARYAHLLSLHGIEAAASSLAVLLGLAAPRYGPAGYTVTDFDRQSYDPVQAEAAIRRDEAVQLSAPVGDNPDAWRYPPLEWLEPRLARLPAATRRLLVFVPTHAGFPRADGPSPALRAECKRRVVRLAARVPRAWVLDLARPTALTCDNTNWWDALHLRLPAAARLTAAIAALARGRAAEEGIVLLAPAPEVGSGPAGAMPFPI